jgi:AraC-like DNA-binding protein
LKNIVDDYYRPLFEDTMFIKSDNTGEFPPLGSCWYLSETMGSGRYWIYNSKRHFNIKIHDFWFKEDNVIDMTIPECLSSTYYESISGEELNPYRRLIPNVVKNFLGGYKPFKAVIHKNIPIRSIGIEWEPEYYENYLKKSYPKEYSTPQDAFRCVDETSNFPEMVFLLNQIKKYRGEGLSAQLYYEAKAAEALSLIYGRQRKIQKQKKPSLSDMDKEMIWGVTTYINDHYADQLSLKHLAKIACMGTTKLKSCFKIMHNCTIGDYIQIRRIGQAEHLLTYTDLNIGQVANAVGYSNPGRFAELFRKSTGILPGEYIKIARRR